MIVTKLQFYIKTDGGGDHDYFRFSLLLLLSCWCSFGILHRVLDECFEEASNQTDSLNLQGDRTYFTCDDSLDDYDGNMLVVTYLGLRF